MTRILLTATLVASLLLAAPASVRGQSAADVQGISLTVGHWGLALGDVPRVNGIRINLRDERLERVNGVNLTLWKPDEDVGGVVNGLAVGLVSPQAGRLQGLSVGGGAVVGERSLAGVQLGGLAVVSEGSIRGLGLGGLAVVGEERVRGLNVGGLAVVSEGEVGGVGVGGLAVVGQGGLRGANAAGLAVVSGADIDGVAAAGLAVVAEDDIRGAALAGYKVDAGSVRWISAAGWLEARSATGLSVAAYNDVSGVHRGLAVGLFNSAGELHGLQIGLLNHAGNNRPPFRWLPIVNAHF